MTGVEIALSVLTIIMLAGSLAIWSKTRAWQPVALWVAVIMAVAYWLGLIH